MPIGSCQNQLHYSPFSLNLATYLFEEWLHLEFTRLVEKIWLDVQVCIVDDCNEHVDKNEEDEEYVDQEVQRPKDTLSIAKGLKIEVTQNDTEKGQPSEEKKH